MKRFKNILYLVNPDIKKEARIIDKVCNLARLNEAKVTVVRLFEEGFLEQFGRLFSDRSKEMEGLVEKEHQEELDLFLADKKWQGIKVSGLLLSGKGFISVIRQVLRERHDLVIKAGELSEGLDQLSMRLIRKCPCPVWVMKNSDTADFKRILAAVDVGSDNSETKALNRKIVELTYSLAQREQGEAHYLHAWRLEYEMMMRGPRFNVSLEEVVAIKKELRQSREVALHALLNDRNIPVSPANTHLIEGETGQMITSMLDKLAIDVLVMGTIGRSGVPGLLIGNMAEKVLSNINRTVLTVKPDGFVSPVIL